jgi:hypothetical protein
VRWILCAIVVIVACEHTQSPPAPPPTPTPTPPPTPTPTPVPPTPTPAPDAATYPAEAIRAAESAIQQRCAGLVYKDGCRRLRRGSIELSVTLDASGSQTHVETLTNTAAPDGPLVLSCVTKALASHSFAPPGAATTLTVRFQLADMC